MAHEVETMAFFGQLPWHGLGTALEEADLYDWPSASQKAGLDWEVELAPLITADTQAKVTHRAVRRTSDSKVLGVVGPRYAPLQNKDAFQWFNRERRRETMATQQLFDWSDVKSAAEKLAGNWREFDFFVWHRAYDLEDAASWMIWYTSSRDAGLLEQSNEQAINKRLKPFAEGDDPDVVFESHSHWAVGHVDGFSVRVFKPDGTITPAFEEFCRIKEELDAYPILDESDYADREYEGTLQNYREELWRLRDDLPEGWESEVYSWFSDHGHDEFIENRDDRGGWAPKEKLIEALESLGLYPQEADQPVIVDVLSS